MTPVLIACGLAKAYGSRPVLREASLVVHAGELVAVLGASGSGKTTLFRCITRLTEPDAGEIEVAGRPLHRLRGRRLAEARHQIGVVFQQFNLIRRLSALDNVLAGRLAQTPLWRVLLRRFRAADLAIARRALSDVGLADCLAQRADTLSGGQQQRVAIARALAQDSRVLLADEPVASLDPEAAVAILALLKGLARTANLAVCCTLHQPLLAERFADRVYVMADGRLAERTAAGMTTVGPTGAGGDPGLRRPAIPV
jgi:phosphonate transport system ATP-binding protein